MPAQCEHPGPMCAAVEMDDQGEPAGLLVPFGSVAEAAAWGVEHSGPHRWCVVPARHPELVVPAVDEPAGVAGTTS